MFRRLRWLLYVVTHPTLWRSPVRVHVDAGDTEMLIHYARTDEPMTVHLAAGQYTVTGPIDIGSNTKLVGVPGKTIIQRVI